MAPEEEGHQDAVPPDPWETRPAANHVGHNGHGRLVQAETVHGGVHFHESLDSSIESALRRIRHESGLGPDRIRDVLDTFCPSDARKYTVFTEELARHRLGLITGEPGRGRTHTAVHALATLSPGTPVDEVVIDADTADAGLADFTPAPDRPRFLDLSDLPAPGAGQRVAVRTLVERVRVSGALLVLVCRPGPWEQELSACRARLRIDAPVAAADVFRRTMARRYGADRAGRWADTPRVAAALSGAGPERAVRLVREAERTRPPHAPLAEEDHAAWIDRALKDFTDPADVLPGWSRDGEGTEFRRVLTQSVALLEGAPSATVLRHAHRLAEAWGVPPVRPTPVSGDGFSGDLAEIGARVRDDRVRFHRPGHRDDALDHLWREHPDARGPFQEWACGAVRDLPRRERVRVARRWLDLARRHRDPQPVDTLLHRWAASPALRWAAVPVLAEAAVTRELGSAVRSRLYRVAASSKATSQDLMVLEVCRVYGRVQPGTALTRLRHIAGKAPEKWTESLLRALVEIAAEPGNLPRVLETVSGWSGPGAGIGATALLRLLHGAGGEAPGLQDALERGALRTETVAGAWAASFRAGADVERALWSWFDTLSDRPGTGGPTAAALTDAAVKAPGFAAELRGCARRWSHAHTRTSPAVEELRRTLDEI
ncbi:hypothetical protein [Nocardiopsis sp. CNT312]|uniref:hypothetical protein n=1 Tax=Nocardiopsis sp. CNT312 TaxID=1137268 RepID=UPI0004B6EDB6|nr:hypothetical protein [Nocardiopsis sp. CNT312]